MTLKTASYDSMQVNPADSSLQLTAEVPSLQELDKYMQVFDLPEFNNYFSNVRIGSFGTTQSASGNAVRFTVVMNYDPSLVQYHAPAGSH